MPILVQNYRTSNRLDQKRKCPLNLIIKTLSIKKKGRLLKVMRGKAQVVYKDIHIRIILGFLVETLKARRTWTDVHRCQPRLPY